MDAIINVSVLSLIAIAVKKNASLFITSNINAPSVSVSGGNVTVTPEVLSITASVQAVAILYDNTVSVGILSLVTSVQSPTISTSGSITVSAEVLSLVISVQVPTINYDYTITEYEDLTSYIEIDGDQDILVSKNKVITDTILVTANSAVYKDYGTDYFGNFTHEFEVCITNESIVAGIARNGVWCLSNQSAVTLNDMDTTNLGLAVYLESAIGVTHIELQNYSDDSNDFFNAILNTTYYLRVIRTSTTNVCEIYSNAARTSLLDTLSVTYESTAFRYINVLASYEAGAGIDTTSFFSQGYNLRKSSTVSLTTNLNTPIINTGGSVTVTPGILSVIGSVNSPILSLDTTQTPVALNIIVNVNQPNLSLDLTINPAILSIVSSINLLSLSLDTSIVTDILSVLVNLNDPIINTGGSITISVGILSVIVNLNSINILYDSVFSVGILNTTTSVNTVNILLGITISTDILSLLTNILSPSLSLGTTIPTNILSIIVGMNDLVISGESIFVANILDLTTNINIPTISVIANVTFSAEVLAVLVNLLSPSVGNIINITLSPSILVITINLVNPTMSLEQIILRILLIDFKNNIQINRNINSNIQTKNRISQYINTNRILTGSVNV